MLRAALLIASATATGAALAQPSLIFEVDDPVLLPGESTTVRLFAGFDPRDFAIAGVATSVFASGGGWSDLTLIAPMDGPGTSTGAASGSGVDGILAGQLNFPATGGIYADDTNPIAFWQATYTADVVTDPTIVDIRTETTRYDVYVERGSAQSESRLDELIEGAATIEVIPAPASAVVLAGGVLVLRRRR
ncbi:MAG: hypothetical protein AAFV77_09140 [Planctomycetota bacterium]